MAVAISQQAMAARIEGATDGLQFKMCYDIISIVQGQLGPDTDEGKILESRKSVFGAASAVLAVINNGVSESAAREEVVEVNENNYSSQPTDVKLKFMVRHCDKDDAKRASDIFSLWKKDPKAAKKKYFTSK